MRDDNYADIALGWSRLQRADGARASLGRVETGDASLTAGLPVISSPRSVNCLPLLFCVVSVHN